MRVCVAVHMAVFMTVLGGVRVIVMVRVRLVLYGLADTPHEICESEADKQPRGNIPPEPFQQLEARNSGPDQDADQAKKNGACNVS